MIWLRNPLVSPEIKSMIEKFVGMSRNLTVGRVRSYVNKPMEMMLDLNSKVAGNTFGSRNSAQIRFYSDVQWGALEFGEKMASANEDWIPAIRAIEMQAGSPYSIELNDQQYTRLSSNDHDALTIEAVSGVCKIMLLETSDTAPKWNAKLPGSGHTPPIISFCSDMLNETGIAESRIYPFESAKAMATVKNGVSTISVSDILSRVPDVIVPPTQMKIFAMSSLSSTAAPIDGGLKTWGFIGHCGAVDKSGDMTIYDLPIQSFPDIILSGNMLRNGVSEQGRITAVQGGVSRFAGSVFWYSSTDDTDGGDKNRLIYDTSIPFGQEASRSFGVTYDFFSEYKYRNNYAWPTKYKGSDIVASCANFRIVNPRLESLKRFSLTCLTEPYHVTSPLLGGMDVGVKMVCKTGKMPSLSMSSMRHSAICVEYYDGMAMSSSPFFMMINAKPAMHREIKRLIEESDFNTDIIDTIEINGLSEFLHDAESITADDGSVIDIKSCLIDNSVRRMDACVETAAYSVGNASINGTHGGRQVRLVLSESWCKDYGIDSSKYSGRVAIAGASKVFIRREDGNADVTIKLYLSSLQDIGSFIVDITPSSPLLSISRYEKTGPMIQVPGARSYVRLHSVSNLKTGSPNNVCYNTEVPYGMFQMEAIRWAPEFKTKVLRTLSWQSASSGEVIDGGYWDYSKRDIRTRAFRSAEPESEMLRPKRFDMFTGSRMQRGQSFLDRAWMPVMSVAKTTMIAEHMETDDWCDRLVVGQDAYRHIEDKLYSLKYKNMTHNIPGGTDKMLVAVGSDYWSISDGHVASRPGRENPAISFSANVSDFDPKNGEHSWFPVNDRYVTPLAYCGAKATIEKPVLPNMSADLGLWIKRGVMSSTHGMTMFENVVSGSKGLSTSTPVALNGAPVNSDGSALTSAGLSYDSGSGLANFYLAFKAEDINSISQAMLYNSNLQCMYFPSSGNGHVSVYKICTSSAPVLSGTTATVNVGVTYGNKSRSEVLDDLLSSSVLGKSSAQYGTVGIFKAGSNMNQFGGTLITATRTKNSFASIPSTYGSDESITYIGIFNDQDSATNIVKDLDPVRYYVYYDTRRGMFMLWNGDGEWLEYVAARSMSTTIPKFIDIRKDLESGLCDYAPRSNMEVILGVSHARSFSPELVNSIWPHTDPQYVANLISASSSKIERLDCRYMAVSTTVSV